MQGQRMISPYGWLLASLVGLCAMAGCVTEPMLTTASRIEEVAPVELAPGPDARIYVYPKRGQSDTQLDRDRYECHLWAVKQSGFDPGVAGVPPHQRVVIVRQDGPSPGAAVASGAIAGAVLGVAVSRPRDAGSGAVIGAIAGAALSAITSQDRPPTRHVVETQASRDIERNAANYRRAIGACLDARDYSVR
jgi:hypothetical protein